MLQKNNVQFLNGIISIIDGEKDPRNLMVGFSILKVLLKELDITGQVDVSIIQFTLTLGFV